MLLNSILEVMHHSSKKTRTRIFLPVEGLNETGFNADNLYFAWVVEMSKTKPEVY